MKSTIIQCAQWIILFGTYKEGYLIDEVLKLMKERNIKKDLRFYNPLINSYDHIGKN